ncbi:3-dehydroquinate synthase [Dacryopinax primogenitus]|uniref:3-dehydroquinate synthase n=1 Tax=Dacryopinax primogenitus (strain DJM 731) TaxID=1858805 RepID=M5G5V7_DACPD|nr:3-dehydroquinate synthase [Dacryopinax primogenitus]EJU01177.1 3-dehydroquinate synthase [Dacryopinax primogenitus]
MSSALYSGGAPSSDMSATVQVVPQGFEVSGTEDLHYAFKFASGVFDLSQSVLHDCYEKWGRVLAVMDANVEGLYGAQVRAYFEHHKISCMIHVMPGGEMHKTMTTMLSLVDAFDKFGLIRKEPVLVIGGGLVTDVTGYACASYRRSSNFIRVPTTLIGLIDAAVSIKVGINHGKLKNRLGAYHAPMLTVLDFNFLRTLAENQIRNGFAELIKISSVMDTQLWADMVKYGPQLVATAFGRRSAPMGQTIDGGWEGTKNGCSHVISPSEVSLGELAEIADSICYRGIKIMLELETPNLHEIMLDRVIAFGHTWSPTLELTPVVPLRHGHAIMIDMAFSATLAWKRGYITAEEREELHKLAHDVGLSLDHEVFNENLLEAGTAAILKTRDGKQRFAVPRPIGSCFFINDATTSELASALATHKEIVGASFPDLAATSGVGKDAYVDSQDLGMEPSLLLAPASMKVLDTYRGENGTLVDGNVVLQCGC